MAGVGNQAAWSGGAHSRCWLLLLIALGLTLTATEAQAGDPELRWRSVETPHFRITYHEPLGAVAQKLGVVAERANQMLAPLLKHQPRFRTEVLITDDTDSSNGSATALPFPTVRLFLTAPDDRSELNDYDDWLFALFVHEYTHILHLDTINGLPKWLNYLAGFGVNTIYSPNQVQPRWFIEGLAVFEETERTSAGRLRSTLFDMYLRAHVLENRFLRLDQVSNQTILFPRGNVPYLYGSAFLRYLAKRYGPELLTQVSQSYGGCWSPDCWVPWGMNRGLRPLTGLLEAEQQKRPLVKGQRRPKGPGYDVLYRDFQADLTARYRAQQQSIVASPLGLSVEQAVSDWKLGVDRPLLTPDGQELLWLESDPYRRPALMRLDRKSGKSHVELEIDGASGLGLSPDGKSAVMSRLGTFRGSYSYNELVLYRRDRRTLVPLSEGLRADNPAISPDGRQVAFEANSTGTRLLGVMALPDTSQPDSERQIDRRAVAVPEVWRARAAAPVRFPLKSRPFSQVYTPAWSPDGKQLAFSAWQEGGYRDILILELASGRVREVTHDRALDLEPSYSPDGEYLYFVSDRSGVFNVYAYHLKTDTTWQVTNVVNGLFAPVVSADATRLYAVGFVAEGYRVESLPLDPAKFLLAPAPLLERPEASPVPPVDESPGGRLPVHVYNPARTFFRTPLSLLNFQLPISGPGPYGQTFGLQFSTADLVGLHNLSFGLTLNSGRADATSGFARYTYGGLWNSLYLDVSRSLYPRGGLKLNGRDRSYDEEALTVSTGTTLPILREPARAANLTAAYSLAYTRNKTAVAVPGPDDISPVLPEVGRFSTLSFGFSYNDSRSFLYSVGNEAGRYLGVSASLSHPALGSRYIVYSLRWQIQQYVGIPWPWRWAKNHTLSLGYNGGISGGDLVHRGVFYLGGFAPSEDFLRAALLGQRPGQPSLRGYGVSDMYGDQLHVLSAEYRFPIVWLERGFATLPLFLYRLHAALYSDAGAAFTGKLGLDRFKVSLGGELRLDGLLGYYLPFMLQVGYAHGFMEGADRRVYFLLNNPI